MGESRQSDEGEHQVGNHASLLKGFIPLSPNESKLFRAGNQNEFRIGLIKKDDPQNPTNRRFDL
jgi:hypothetical protein